MAQIICSRRWDARKFTWDHNARLATAESSDLCALRDGSPFAPLYGDACDIGFTLLGKDGRNVTSWYVGEVYNTQSKPVRSGEDVGYWELKPTPETVRMLPHLANWSIHLFND